ncbi:MAG: copper-binding protein [Candidatus Omnitrophica bacterium]|nr:copper-binding protein [Candidatus Omnitrophota bacterium]
MKKIVGFLLLSCILSSSAFAAPAKVRHFDAQGEVLSVDPVYGQVTIHHEAIAGFAESADTEFFVSKNDLIKNISRGDLVEFTVTDNRGDVRIEKLKKVGKAPVKDDRLPIGAAVQGVLEATGEVAKGITLPIEPAHQVVSGTMDATTGATGAVLNDISTENKKEF